MYSPGGSVTKVRDEVDDNGAEDRPNLAAGLRRLNREPRLVKALEGLRSRLPGDPRFGDPLSTAGEKPVHVVAREVSTVGSREPGAIQHLGMGALQVWQALSEAAGRGQGTEELTLLFTDLVEYSSWALEAGDSAALELLRETGIVVETAIAEHGGRIVKRLGDGLMASFLGPQSAVEAALDARGRVSEIEVAGYTPQLRAGIHHGRPRKLGGDYFGVDVNIAARVGATAKGDQILVSEPAADLLDTEGLELGRAKKLRAQGAPPDLRVREVSRAAS